MICAHFYLNMIYKVTGSHATNQSIHYYFRARISFLQYYNRCNAPNINKDKVSHVSIIKYGKIGIKTHYGLTMNKVKKFIKGQD